MMDRDKVVQDAFNRLSEQGILPNSPVDRRAAALVVYDVVEPVARADERQRIMEMPGDDPSYGWHFEYMQDQLVFAEEIAARLVRVIGELEERNAVLLDALEDVVNQACSPDSSGEMDSMALSAYAYGLRTLAELGRVKITSERGRRVIAEWVKE